MLFEIYDVCVKRVKEIAEAVSFVLGEIMANEQNLKPFNSETAKLNQPKAVESRYKNKIKMGLIADAILEELSEDDLREIARGIIERSKNDSDDLVKLRDTIGEKPKDSLELQGDAFEIRVHNVE